MDDGRTLVGIVGEARIGDDVSAIVARATGCYRRMARSADAIAARRARQAEILARADASMRGASSAALYCGVHAAMAREASTWWAALATALRSV